MIQILSWALGISLLLNFAGIPLSHWLGHRDGVADGRAALQVEIDVKNAKQAAAVAAANEKIAPEQESIASIVANAIAARPERTRVIERLVESNPDFAAVTRPPELHAARVERLQAIAGAAK